MSVSRAGLIRLMSHKLRAELTLARGGDHPPPLPWPEDWALDGPDLACDSLELMTLASAASQMFHWQEAGIGDLPLVRRRIGAWADFVAQAWKPDQARVSVLTSGTTGAPKACPHRLEDLWREVEAFAAIIGPTRRRLVACVPAHHLYGLIFTVLLAERLGLPVEDRAQAGGAPGLAGFASGDLVISFPDHWRALARSGAILPGDVVGVSSTAPCPGEVASDLRARGLARLIEVYGSSETSGIGWRDDPAADYRLLAHWRRAGQETLAREDGRTIEAPDRLAWSGADHLRPAGRRDGAIQIGGVNVSLAVVAETLRDHPLVADCRVRLLPTEQGGRIGALIVPRGGAGDDAIRADVAAWIERHLPPPARPRRLVFAAAIPKGPMGKDAPW